MFAAVNLDPNIDVPGFDAIVQTLKRDDQQRTDFLKACLLKLGLRVNQEQAAIPSLSRLHLSSAVASDTSRLIEALEDIITTRDGEKYIKDENDIFHLQSSSSWSLNSIADTFPSVTGNKPEDHGQHDNGSQDKIVDYNKLVKRLLIHDKEQPDSKETPYFNHHAYFANLKLYHNQSQESDQTFGRNLLYGEVVTSTNTMLEKYSLR